MFQLLHTVLDCLELVADRPRDASIIGLLVSCNPNTNPRSYLSEERTAVPASMSTASQRAAAAGGGGGGSGDDGGDGDCDCGCSTATGSHSINNIRMKIINMILSARLENSRKMF